MQHQLHKHPLCFEAQLLSAKLPLEAAPRVKPGDGRVQCPVVVDQEKIRMCTRPLVSVSAVTVQGCLQLWRKWLPCPSPQCFPCGTPPRLRPREGQRKHQRQQPSPEAVLGSREVQSYNEELAAAGATDGFTHNSSGGTLVPAPSTHGGKTGSAHQVHWRVTPTLPKDTSDKTDTACRADGRVDGHGKQGCKALLKFCRGFQTREDRMGNLSLTLAIFTRKKIITTPSWCGNNCRLVGSAGHPEVLEYSRERHLLPPWSHLPEKLLEPSLPLPLCFIYFSQVKLCVR